MRTCVAETRRNRRHLACRRTLPAGRLLLPAAQAGPNRLLFLGRLTPSGVLAPGSYEVSVTASNASGQSTSRSLGFTVATR